MIYNNYKSYIAKSRNTKVAEAEIMIAEEGSRGKGLGKEAMTLMLNYGARKLGVRTFEARIKVSLILGKYIDGIV